MRNRSIGQKGGFTLIEVLIGATLSLMVMAAILSSYVFLGKNFTRSLGFSSANEPTIESQGRRALAYFSQDARMASGFSGTPSLTEFEFILPTKNSAKTVTYFFNNTGTDDTSHGPTIKANTLTRIDGDTGIALTLHTNLLQLPEAPHFNYFDSSGHPYTSFINYLPGIAEVSITFNAQAGSRSNGTLTPIYTTTSQRVILRNKQLLR